MVNNLFFWVLYLPRNDIALIWLRVLGYIQWGSQISSYDPDVIVSEREFVISLVNGYDIWHNWFKTAIWCEVLFDNHICCMTGCHRSHKGQSITSKGYLPKADNL